MARKKLSEEEKNMMQYHRTFDDLASLEHDLACIKRIDSSDEYVIDYNDYFTSTTKKLIERRIKALKKKIEQNYR